MAELRSNASQAEQIITQVLHDENGMPSADAIAMAASICRRLTTTRPKVAVAEKLTEANSELWNASVLWELVYNQGSDLRAN